MKKYSPKLWELFSIERRKKKEKEKLKTILLNTVFMQNPYKKKKLSGITVKKSWEMQNPKWTQLYWNYIKHVDESVATCLELL